MSAASHELAARVIAAGRAVGAVPSYGTAAFLELPPSDPRRLASLFIAAECWWDHGRPEVAAQRLRDELADVDAQVLFRLRATSYDVAAAKDWHAVAERPVFAEVEAQRSHYIDEGELRAKWAADAARQLGRVT